MREPLLLNTSVGERILEEISVAGFGVIRRCHGPVRRQMPANCNGRQGVTQNMRPKFFRLD